MFINMSLQNTLLSSLMCSEYSSDACSKHILIDLPQSQSIGLLTIHVPAPPLALLTASK